MGVVWLCCCENVDGYETFFEQCRVHGISVRFVTVARMMEGCGYNKTTGPGIFAKEPERGKSFLFREELFHPVPDPENHIHGYRLQCVDIGCCAV